MPDRHSYGYNALGALNVNAPETTSTVLVDTRPRIGGSGPGDTAPSAVMSSVNGSAVGLDPAGRVTSLNGTTLGFDKQDRLDTVTTSATTDTFYYDAFFRRVQHQSGSSGAVNDVYVYEGPEIAFGMDATGTVVDSFLYDGVDEPIRFGVASTCSVANVSYFTIQPYYYEQDLAGNVRRIHDALGNDLGGYRYTAFGQLLAANTTTPAVTQITQPLMWKGRPFVNVAGGLYDMRARWWSPQMGAFLSVDAFAYHDPNSTLWGWPGQNPITWRDPTGHYVGPPTNPWVPGAQNALFGASAYFAAQTSADWAAGNYFQSIFKAAVTAATGLSGAALGFVPQEPSAASMLGAPELGVVYQGEISADDALSGALQWLGPGYSEIAPGVYRSADGLRQFRMTAGDLAGHHGMGPHVHFEALDSNGDATENARVPICK